ncbi:hypothetical protein [Mucilaginibacter terrigena]|nr:hypothetical protein [Mucilaginibacter terrigena]
MPTTTFDKKYNLRCGSNRSICKNAYQPPTSSQGKRQKHKRVFGVVYHV